MRAESTTSQPRLIAVSAPSCLCNFLHLRLSRQLPPPRLPRPDMRNVKRGEACELLLSDHCIQVVMILSSARTAGRRISLCSPCQTAKLPRLQTAALYRRSASTNATSHPLARKPQLTTTSPNNPSSNQARQSWSTATALLLATLTGAAVCLSRSPLAFYRMPADQTLYAVTDIPPRHAIIFVIFKL